MIREFTTEIPFSSETVRKVGDIIVRHKVQNYIGAVYVHRHFEMPENSIAVTSQIANNTEVMRFSPLSAFRAGELQGDTFKVREDGKVQAFEYSASGVDLEIPRRFSVN